mgnify:CR=1 FL=1
MLSYARLAAFQSRIPFILFCLYLLIFHSACAPGLGSSIAIAGVGKTDFAINKIFLPEDDVKVNVLQFADLRTIEAIAQIDGRLIRPDGDVGQAAQRIFENGVKSLGIKLSFFDAPSVRGKIREWQVQVFPAFPASGLKAKAVLNVELLGITGAVIRSAEYLGEYREEHPFMTEDKIQSALASAMKLAVEELLKDKQFIDSLVTASSYRHDGSLTAPFNPNLMDY